VDQRFATANEIHVPVGRPVRLKLDSQDVIHSLWVPNLAGKMDLITGQHNELQFVAVREGPLSCTVRGVLRVSARAHGNACARFGSRDIPNLAGRTGEARAGT
jgi:cytochrome c oxidase subunit II-like protein